MRTPILCMAVLCLCQSIFSQSQQRCEWHAPQTVESKTHVWQGPYYPVDVPTSHTFAQPFDLSALDGASFDAPRTVTRIDRTALAFADDGVSEGADIVYMVDMSGSMSFGAESGGVITYEGDTLYRARGGDQTGFPVGTVTKIVQGEPREFDLYCCSDRNDLDRVPGDPFYESWGMMKESILLLRDLSATAYAGHMPFRGQYKRDNDPSSGAHGWHMPLANVSSGHPEAIENLIELWRLGSNDLDDRYLPGPPLPLSKTRKAQWTAVQWGLEDAMEELQTKGQTPNRAVILFTDGEIHDASAQHLDDATIASYPYPVYAVNLVTPLSDSNFTAMRITDGTGGKHLVARPGDQDSLAAIMREIIGEVTGARVPAQIELVNNSLAPPQTSMADNWGFHRNPDRGGWTVTLDSVLALAEGENRLTLTVTFLNGATGEYETESASFTINVSGGEGDDQYRTCFTPATLSLRGQSGASSVLNPGNDTCFELTLVNSAFDLVGRMNSVSAVSRVLGDTLLIQCDDTITKDMSAFPYETFTTMVSYAGGAAAANPADDILQSAREDEILIRWEHPRDPRDTALLVVSAVAGRLWPPAASPGSGTYEGATLAVSLVDQNPTVDPTLRYSIDNGAFQAYTEPLQFDAGRFGASHTVRAYAAATGYLNSDTVSFHYVQTLPRLDPPVADPAPGIYDAQQIIITVADSNTHASSSIMYSIDGEQFKTYVAPLVLSRPAGTQSYAVRMYAAAEGYLNSDTVTVAYTLTTGTAIRGDTAPGLPGKTPPATHASAGGPFSAPEIGGIADNGVTITATTLFSPRDRIPARIAGALHGAQRSAPRRGAAIRIESARPVDCKRSRVIIHDAVGNVVADMQVYGERENARCYWAFWDGRHQSGAPVGAGSYLATIKLIIDKRQLYTQRILLGVRH